MLLFDSISFLFRGWGHCLVNLYAMIFPKAINHLLDRRETSWIIIPNNFLFILLIFCGFNLILLSSSIFDLLCFVCHFLFQFLNEFQRGSLQLLKIIEIDKVFLLIYICFQIKVRNVKHIIKILWTFWSSFLNWFHCLEKFVCWYAQLCCNNFVLQVDCQTLKRKVQLRIYLVLIRSGLWSFLHLLQFQVNTDAINWVEYFRFICLHIFQVILPVCSHHTLILISHVLPLDILDWPLKSLFYRSTLHTQNIPEIFVWWIFLWNGT